MKKLFTLIFVFMLFPLAYADELDGTRPIQVSMTSADSLTNLKRGKELFDKAKYTEALEHFTSAYDEIPVMRDFTLLMMATLYHRTARFDDSVDSLRKLLETYPDSLFVQRARALQINSLMQAAETAPKEKRFSGKSAIIITCLESYVADYPEDLEMVFSLAQVMKQVGNVQKAKKLFIRIYTGVGPYSESALKELQPSDITMDDILMKASNLIKAFEYKKAETLIRKTLQRADGGEKDELYKKLGLALFRQKKYREAADTFLKGGDLYDSARSLYRAGDFIAFNEILSTLVSMEDKRAGSLLLAYASAKRREGKKDDSLSMYAELRKKFPQYGGDALWGIAWTYYRAGDYAEALEILTELNDRTPDPRYRYWKQQSNLRNKAGTASSENQMNVPVSQKDFYSLLTLMSDTARFSGRSLRQIAYTPAHDQPVTVRRQTSLELEGLPPEIRSSLERFRILMELNMSEDAISELVRISNRISKPDELVYLCRTLQNAGAYKRAISLVSRFTAQAMQGVSETNIHDILYPVAYWSAVLEISEHNTLDPFLLLSVIREESRFDPRARSVAGALGLLQVMPRTAHKLSRHLNLDISDDAALYDIKTNITIGGYYLNSLLKEFGSLPAALAAYNAGRDKVREWIKEGHYRSVDEFIEDIPYDETRDYVKRVLLTYATYMNLWEKQ
ncbi:MAG TPA: transglycosylase SLT domain-containing protein [Thermodesulfovibrionales bacterium]|nr:transglycosylase SLT domain-containing protein [Thermodesulfovibrionales bacterium]